MKKFFIAALIAVSVSFTASAQETTTITKYEDKPIHGIKVSGAFDVQLCQAGGDRQNGAKVEIEKELADKLVFEYTEEGYVRLGFKDDMSKYFTRSKKKPQAWIVVTDLAFLSVNGASSVVCTSLFTSPGNVQIITAGTSSANLIDVTAKTAQVQVDGTSKLDDVTLKLSGKLTLEQTGTTKVNGKLEAAEASIKVGGVSSISLSGKCGEAVVDISGTSSADLQALVVGKLKASVGGVSKMQANVTESGVAEVTGMSSFKYTGSGLVTGKGVKRID